MADRFWVDDDVSGLYNSANNWSATTGGAGGAGVPGTSDKAIFDGGNTTDCRLNASMFVAEIDMQAAYTGTIDGATDDLDHGIIGDVTLAGTAITMGDGTWACGGNWDSFNIGTFTRGLSTVALTGLAKTFRHTTNATKSFSALLITGLYTLTGDSIIGGDIGITGSLIGASELRVDSGAAITDISGAITIATLSFLGTHHTDAANGLIAAGTYGASTVKFYNGSSSTRTVRLSGAYTFTGNVQIYTSHNGTYNFDNSSANPDITFHGDVAIDDLNGGTVTYTKGTGTITLTGGLSGTQTIDLGGKSIEAVVVNASGATKQFTLDSTLVGLDITAGTVDPNGKTFTLGASGFTITDPGILSDPAGATFVVSGPISFAGIPTSKIDLAASGAWTLTANGAASASWVQTENSDASGGGAILARNSTDNGAANNTNWIFAPSTTRGLRAIQKPTPRLALLERGLP